MINLHTHTRFSDGSDQPEAYIAMARLAGMQGIGFSDHSPLPFDNSFALREERVREYCDTILTLKDEQPDDFRVLLGMEIDFIPGIGHSFRYFRETFPLEYVIGSVHLVRNGRSDELWFIDGPDPATYYDGLFRLFGGNIRTAVTAYYHQINEMLSGSPMEIIGHLDKIKMHNRNRFFREEEPWYVRLVEETLALVLEKKVTVEVNTRGLYKKRSDSHFPGSMILKMIRELGIPVIISSDAHRPDEVGSLFSETTSMLREMGLKVTPLPH